MNAHRTALDTAIVAAGKKLTAVDEPLVQLTRTLANQIDAAGPGGPGTRLVGTYLTALRTLLARIGVINSVPDGGKLAKLRAEHHQRSVHTQNSLDRG
jgi:hypothetical protein